MISKYILLITFLNETKVIYYCPSDALRNLCMALDLGV